MTDDDISLDYIFTRDVFNEGVDIPLVNQILMLRPTQSAIIFVQQLGRGLRRTKDPDKSLIVLDFIGNYDSNFMIPIALSGDKSCDKDKLRKFMMGRFLPGCSTIGFERIVEDRILSNINHTSPSALMKLLVSEYLSMKSKLGHLPTLCELLHEGSLNPVVLVKDKTRGNLNNFRRKAKQEYINMTEAQDDVLTFISSFVDGKRIHELKILRHIVDSFEINIDSIDDPDVDSIQSAIRVLDGEYQTKGTLSSHPSWKIIENDGKTIHRSKTLDSMLSVPEMRELIIDVIDCGEEIASLHYVEKDDLGFTLYQKYERKDVSRILNWGTDQSGVMNGYKTVAGACPVFITYEKGKDISPNIRYVEGFESRDVFNWVSRHNRKITSREIEPIINSSSNGLKIPVFIKKSDVEGRDYYYMGQAKPIVDRCKQVTMSNGEPIVEIPLRLKQSVPEDLYGYLTSGDGSS